jgi:hemerythrin-like domain-containing protein
MCAPCSRRSRWWKRATIPPKRVLSVALRPTCRLLREHIEKEDEILFRMVDEVISADQQKKLLALFAEHEAKQIGAGAHEKYLNIARELETVS